MLAGRSGREQSPGNDRRHPRTSRRLLRNSGVCPGRLRRLLGSNFLECDRDQVLLLPPSLREWLPDDHFAWFVIDAVDRLDLRSFYAGGFRRSTQQLGHLLSWGEPAQGLAGAAVELGGDAVERG